MNRPFTAPLGGQYVLPRAQYYQYTSQTQAHTSLARPVYTVFTPYYRPIHTSSPPRFEALEDPKVPMDSGWFSMRTAGLQARATLG